MKSIEHAMVMNGAFAAEAMKQALAGARMTEERLPFTVRVVRSDDALQKAVVIRQAAYARHLPTFAATLAAPEPNDREQGSVVLLAESRMDGSPVGTMRIQTNRFSDLTVERSVELPGWLQDRSLAEATRLGVALGRSGRVVKTALFKALYFYCLEAGIEWMVIGARSPLDRMYEALLFQDLFPGQLIPLRHFDNIPHRILAFDVVGARAQWEEASHPLLDFMCYTHHPDIDIRQADVSLGDLPLGTAELSTKVANIDLDNADFSIRSTHRRAGELFAKVAVGV